MLKSSVRLALLESVTWTPAAGQPPDEPGIDGAEQDLAAFGPLAQAVVRVEQVLDLGAGEIGVDTRPVFSRKTGSSPSAFSRSQIGGAGAALPDDGVGDRPAGRAIPEDRRFALIGDADRGDLLGRKRRPAASARRATASCDDQIASGSCSTSPGAGRICSNSCWADGHDAAVAAEHDRPAGRRALIQRENVLVHRQDSHKLLSSDMINRMDKILLRTHPHNPLILSIL